MLAGIILRPAVEQITQGWHNQAKQGGGHKLAWSWIIPSTLSGERKGLSRRLRIPIFPQALRSSSAKSGSNFLNNGAGCIQMLTWL